MTGHSASAAPEDALRGLDPEQRAVAEALRGPVCVLAGAGTGKTRAITHRIAHGIATGAYAPDRVLALTFTTRAAGELRGRLRALGAPGVAARTFHAAALAQLSHFWPTVVGGTAPRVLDGKARLLAEVADGMGLRIDTAVLRDLAAEIEWRKVSQLSIDDYARASRATPQGLSTDAVVAVQVAYEEAKDARRRIDFEDVLLATAGMLATEPQVAEEVRQRYRFFVVDEYQDVSPLQRELLGLWLGTRSDLCVVGDANQTIFSFTGASDRYLLGFEREFPGARVIRLERNYRSTGGILAPANRLMRARPGAIELRSEAGAGGVPTLIELPDEQAEAAAVANAIAAQIAGGAAPESIAVLFRINAQAAGVEAALARVGVASRPLGGIRFFDQPVVKRAVLELGSLARTGAAGPLFKSVSDVVRNIGWTVEPPPVGGAMREQWEALSAIVGLADAAAEGTTLAQFVDELTAREQSRHEPDIPAVALSTLHGAKGLEWDSVYIVGLVEGLLPVSYAKGLAQIDEERRLLYVGITRARRRLTLSWATGGPRAQGREPSRFLAELSTGTPDAARRVAR